MAELTAKLAEEVVAACQQGADEAAKALSRAFTGEFTLGAPKQSLFAAEPSPNELAGPGLVILLTIGNAGLAIALPESSGLLPAWFPSPDADAASKLATLAKELGSLIVPSTLAADAVEARRVASIQEALASARPPSDAALVAMDATSGGNSGKLKIVWPLATPAAMFIPGAAAQAPPAPASASGSPKSRETARQGGKATSMADLPHYARTLLKIRIPVSVQLASKHEKVQEVVELVPGAIVKFDKGCDELLQMVVGGQPIAEGEAVKIGDKFGFRVTGLLAPREHFIPVRRPRATR